MTVLTSYAGLSYLTRTFSCSQRFTVFVQRLPHCRYFLQRFLVQDTKWKEQDVKNAQELITWTILAEFWYVVTEGFADTLSDAIPRYSYSAPIGDRNNRFQAKNCSNIRVGDRTCSIFLPVKGVACHCRGAVLVVSPRRCEDLDRFAQTPWPACISPRPFRLSCIAYAMTRTKEETTIQSLYKSTGEPSISRWIESQRYGEDKIKDLYFSDDSEKRFQDALRAGAQIPRTKVLDFSSWGTDMTAPKCACVQTTRRH